jgi:hypothetical protein
LIQIFIGGYARMRFDFLEVDFRVLSVIPRGVNTNLLDSFDDGQPKFFSFYTLYYELGLLIGSVFLLIMLRLFIILSLLNFNNFYRLFPSFIAYIFFLSSGSNYASGGGLIWLLLIYTQSKTEFNKGKWNLIYA